MLQSGRIAVFAAGSMAMAVMLTTIVIALVKTVTGDSPPALGYVVENGAFPGILLSSIVWVGTYYGARRSKPEARTYRLAKWLAAIYATFGVLLSLPVKTHAVKLDMPLEARGTTPTADWVPWLIGVAILLSTVIVPLLLTCALAAMLARTRSPGA